MIRVGIVDDHPVFRLGLKQVLQRQGDLDVVWEVGTADEVLDLIAKGPIDVVLMDLNLGPDQDALATTQSIMELHDGVKVIVISASLEWEAAAASRRAGACGFLPKDLSVADMVAAIRELASPNFGRKDFSDRLPSRSANRSSWASSQGLTRREQQVLEELQRGYTNREIARRLSVSITTVNKHVQQVLKKLHVRTRGQAMARAHTETAVRHPQPNGVLRR